MTREKTIGEVVNVHKCWWFKINTSAVRKNAIDGAIFPYIVTVRYSVAGKVYNKRKFINLTDMPPCVGEIINVWYDKSKPNKISLMR